MSNFVFHTDTRQVRIYTSSKFTNNIFFTKNFLGNSIIVIGDKLLKELSVNEIKVLIYATLVFLKKKNFLLINFIVLLSFILYPIFFLREKIRNKKIKYFLSYILHPFYIFRKYYSNNNLENDLDKKIIQLEGLKKDYITAIFKISKYEMANEISFSGFILNDLVLVLNKSDNVIVNSFSKSNSIENRIKQML